MSKATTNLNWLNTTGGPFVCGDAATAKSWRGVCGSSGPPPDESDYDRACKISNYHQDIPCGAGRLVILGDEPLQSALFINSRSEPCIARWVYSKTSHIDEAIFKVHPFHELEKPIRISLLSGSLVLFDSSAPFDRCEPNAAGRITIDPGNYEITAEYVEKEKDFNFIFHRFLRI